MGIPEVAGEVVKALIPPKTNDLDAQQRWRWIVFAAIVGLASALTLHIALACGFIPQVYVGFASAADTQSIQRSVNQILSISLEREIRYKSQELCTEKDPKVRNILTDDIAKLQRQYYEVERRFYQVPTCDQL